MREILSLNVYVTTAIKCAKTGYAVNPETTGTCSYILEKEVAFFPNVCVFLLMGDTAVRSMNCIALRRLGRKVIPGGSTYTIREQEFRHEGKRFFPSYLQTGRSYFIEKSKRAMITEDLKKALELSGAI
jgi:uracil-DNA glycosylase